MATTIIKVRNPYTGADDYEIAPPDLADMQAAVARLRAAQRPWQAQGIDARIAVLQAWKTALAERRTALLDALVADTGRRMISVYEVDGLGPAIDRWCRLAPELLAEAEGRSEAMPHLTFRTQLQPYPLVGVISPWNFPLTLSLIDVIPALLAGAAVAIKPSEVTPRFAAPLMDAIAAVPELAAVLTIFTGAGATGAALIELVDAICFTGSVATGRNVAEAAARAFIPAFLELGGKDPAIVLASADIERAATALLRGSILNSGQACQSIERIYVARPIYDAFLAALVAKAQAVEINYPAPERGHIGPIIFARQVAIIERQLADARAKGATIHSGGVIEDHGGLWCRPTVISNLTPAMALMREETFGPLLPVIPFDEVAEAVALANDSEFGLSAAVFAATLDEAEAVARTLDVGAVSLNDAALTGVMHEAEKNSFKLSGLGGSRMGPAGLTRFLRKKALIANSGHAMSIDAFQESAVPRF